MAILFMAFGFVYLFVCLLLFCCFCLGFFGYQRLLNYLSFQLFVFDHARWYFPETRRVFLIRLVKICYFVPCFLFHFIFVSGLFLVFGLMLFSFLYPRLDLCMFLWRSFIKYPTWPFALSCSKLPNGFIFSVLTWYICKNSS